MAGKKRAGRKGKASAISRIAKTAMTRKQFIRAAGIGAAGVAAAGLGLSRAAHAKTASEVWAPDIVVNAKDFTPGSGQVAAVQSAVDGFSPYDNSPVGPRILLRGDFDFGAAFPAQTTKPGTVFITRDVDIRGERVDGAYNTTINGGYRTFTVGLKKLAFKYNFDIDEGYVQSLTFAHQAASVSIRDIFFHKPLNYAIWLSATKNETVISGCKFEDAVPLKWSFNQLPIARAITGWTAGIFRYPNQLVGFPRLSGAFRIFGNEMDGKAMSSPNSGGGAVLYSGSYWSGMSHFAYIWGVYGGYPGNILPASVEVRDNDISNFNTAGIAIGGLQGASTVTNNRIDTGAYACPGYGAALFVGEAGYFGEGNALATSTIISKNEMNVANGIGMGLWLIGGNHGIVVDGNSMALSANARGVYTSVFANQSTNSCVFKANKLSGSCSYGFYFAGTSKDNVVVGNNLAKLEADKATFYFGPQTSDNIVKGFSGSVISPPTNFITGWSPMKDAGGIGDEMSSSMTMQSCLMRGGEWDMESETCSK